MIVFRCPILGSDAFEFAIARQSPSTYLVVFARAYGMAAGRQVATLNVSTPQSSNSARFSSSGKPLIWIDSDLDRHSPSLGPEGGVLKALLAAEPPVVRATGRVRGMHMPEGGLRDAAEVEVLLAGDDMARVCWYCSDVELESDVQDGRRFPVSGGEGYEATYMCFRVCPSRFSP
jgi:hypothetical protein